MKRKALYVGKGLYSISDASRLTGIDYRRIYRWICGYQFGKDGTSHSSSPIFTAEYPPIDGSHALSFLDLIEVRFIDAFRKYGVSYNAIRSASERASTILDSPHPFSSKRFLTDKKSIFLRIAQEAQDPELLNLVRGQYELDAIVTPHLMEGLDFSGYDFAARWYPLSNSRAVVIDPQINFGRPIIASSGIPTDALFQCYKTEKSFKKVAEWYEIDEESVKAAVEYESSLAA